ncbi:S-type pyocin domain-containing protein [Pseudomonas sp. Z1-14]|uniref:S-type pyocin domain-containing protein n=1 Tax=Pseudomonas sp. Z1-14 TaxID=2817409 RepID=UPI003DA8C7F3
MNTDMSFHYSIRKDLDMPQEKNIVVNRGIPRTPTSSHGFGFGVGGVSGPDHSDRGFDAVDYAFEWLIESNESVEECFTENIQNITYITDAELANTRAAVRAAAPLETAAYDIELQTLDQQLSKTRADHQQQITSANLYYGYDPLSHMTGHPPHKGFELVGGRGGQRGYTDAIAKWNVSYAAAYQAKFLAEQMKLLEALLAAQNKVVAEAQAKALAAAQAEAQRVAAETAREAAEAEAKYAAEEQARLAAEETAAQAKAQAQANSQAEEEARKAAEAEIRRATQAEALGQALSGRALPMVGAAASPVFAMAGSTVATSPATMLAIQTALRTAVAMAIESLTAVTVPALAGFAALLYSSELGNSDLYALSVPLSELSPDNSDDLQAIAAVQGEIILPLIIGSRTTSKKTEYVVTSTQSAPTFSKVPVRLATLDPLGNFYRSVSPDAASSNIIWTPIVKPDGASTSLPASVPNMIPYTGATPVAVTGRTDTHPEFDLYRFGGFVTVFPADSGIPPIYTVFNSPYEGATTKGEHSGRNFNPEQAGGPIVELDWSTATVTQDGLDALKLHISRLNQSDANDVMIVRLENILSGNINITDTDRRYYTHEIRELERFRNLGLADDFSPEQSSPAWNNAHTATLEDFKVHDHESLLYTSDALAKAGLQDERDYQKLLKEMSQ